MKVREQVRPMIRFVTTCFAIIITCAAAHADEKQVIVDFMRPLVSSLVKSPGDVWEGSGQGGYVFRFFFDVNRDGREEMFLMSSTFPNAWQVYSIDSAGSYKAMEGVGYLPIPASGFEYWTKEHAIVLASLEGEEIIQTQYQFTGNAVTIEMKRFDARKWKPAVKSHVIPKIEKVYLAEYLSDPSSPWKPVDLTSSETVVRGSWYYSFPSDGEKVERWRDFSPEAAMALLNKIEQSFP